MKLNSYFSLVTCVFLKDTLSQFEELLVVVNTICLYNIFSACTYDIPHLSFQ